MKSLNNFSIIFPTHNREQYIEHALKSFLEIEGLGIVKFELIIVANACTDNTRDIVCRLLESVPFSWRFIEEPVAGLSVARNRGIQEAQNEIVVFLDDDIEFDSAWLLGLDKSFQVSNFDIIGGKIDLWWHDCSEPKWFTPFERRLLGHNDHGNKLIPAKPSMIFGGNFAFKKEIFVRLGGFNPNFGRVGNKKGAGEETDFLVRAQYKDVKLGYSPFFCINHLVTSEKIKFFSMLHFSRGAGMASGALITYSIRLWVARLFVAKLVFCKLFFQNKKHAILMAVNNLAKLKILR